MKTTAIPEAARTIIRTLRKSGEKAYLVGGCVRDMLLGRAPKDWDIATSATPQQVTALFTEVIPTGIDFGTVTVVLGGLPFEVTTFRGDGAYTDGRHPDDVRFSKDIGEDLARRDFTINAMAFDPENSFLIDPHCGKADLMAKVITAVGNPASRFCEDALRIARAFRFSAELGFTIDKATLDAMKVWVRGLSRVAVERRSAEFMKFAVAPHASFALWQVSVVPDFIEHLTGRNLPWGVDLSELNEVPRELHLRLAYMFRSYAPKVVVEDLREMRLSNHLTQRVGYLVGAVRGAMELPTGASDVVIRRYLSFLKDKDVSITDVGWVATLQPQLYMRMVEMSRGGPPLVLKDLAVSGDRVIELLGCKGPKVGKVLRHLLDEVLEDPTRNNVEHLEALIRAA
jgi:tRNA nucleotidyltransferase (CCA-adding enzyme)